LKAVTALNRDFFIVDILHLQAITLWISSLGFLVYTWWRPAEREENQIQTGVIVGLFVYALISTLLLGGQAYATLFAPDQIWTGVLSLLSIVLLAWLAAPRINKRTLRYLFWSMAAVALISLISSLPSIAEGQRLAGIVLQPNILAIILGCGYIAGLYAKGYQHSRLRAAGLLVVVIAILLTQTRAVILLLPAIAAPLLLRLPTSRRKYAWLALAAAVVCAALIAPRITSLDRLAYGVTYRYDLAAYGVQNMTVMPPWGFGPDALSTVSGDYFPLPASLQATTVTDQKLLESTHVVVIDRFLEYGWLGGLSYLLLIVLFIVQGVKKRHDPLILTMFAIGCFVLIQQMVTVARFHSELLAWLAMLTVILKKPTESGGHDA
jgi:hypothetical protein